MSLLALVLTRQVNPSAIWRSEYQRSAGSDLSNNRVKRRSEVPPIARMVKNQAARWIRTSWPKARAIAQAVERASCVTKATELVRPLLPFPELLDRENALRKALAGQVQARTMSLLERNVQVQKLHSQLLEEERSRLSGSPADASMPPLAVTQWRQSNGESCGRLGGDSGTCY
ncbi:hypothetical protein PMN64_10705 [Bradyrhizobium sp. UFLA01-814]|uniref:hypothetical protein n=1 Tax=Bradyrhizobium sp. UFLA01-814 TaxID=3023480 RepID=UPI00398B957B